MASDSFYGGYTEKEVPTWFARLWFKLTKGRDIKTSMLTLSEFHPVFGSDSDSSSIDDDVLAQAGSFRLARLPVYRTGRVKSHGSAARLLDCVAGWLSTWQVQQITFAHGSSPYTAARLPADTPSPGQMYLACWRDGLAALAE